MKAIILAAGRGERMRPLTDHTPKPLLAVRGKPLIEWHIEALARGGVREIVINTDWLEDMLIAALGDGSRFGVSIRYSTEGRDHGGALETAGGIATALPLLAADDDAPFWIVSGDIFAPAFRFDGDAAGRMIDRDTQAHLWLVPNPPFHAKGDFGFGADGSHLTQGPGADGRTWTYANLALCRPSLVSHIAPGTRSALGPLLFERSRGGRITGEVFEGTWENVGTPEQLQMLNREG
jgi:N-acetyl-alpha-D-muramate 1-phosphate uridylyltransferase